MTYNVFGGTLNLAQSISNCSAQVNSNFYNNSNNTSSSSSTYSLMWGRNRAKKGLNCE